MAFTPHSTFGIVAQIYNTSGSAAYVTINGLTNCSEIPSLSVNNVLTVTTHGSASATEEKITDGILKWSGPLVLDFLEDSASSAITDPGMVYLIAQVGNTKKFKLTLAGITAPIYYNAIIESVVQGARPLSGEATIKVTLMPTGVAPTS
jgi:hypothetical protein